MSWALSRLGTAVNTEATITADELRSVLTDDTKARLHKILSAFVRKAPTIGTLSQLVLAVTKEGLGLDSGSPKSQVSRKWALAFWAGLGIRSCPATASECSSRGAYVLHVQAFFDAA